MDIERGEEVSKWLNEFVPGKRTRRNAIAHMSPAHEKVSVVSAFDIIGGCGNYQHVSSQKMWSEPTTVHWSDLSSAANKNTEILYAPRLSRSL
jgi:hypothetical protein